MAIHNKNNTLPKRLAIGAAVATTFLAGYSSRPVYAGSCTLGVPGTYTCSGAADALNDTSQNLSSTTSLTVTTSAGFGINTAAGDAINLYVSAGGTFIDFIGAASTITGYSTGIYARNFGTGATSITSSGLVTGTSNNGIYASNYGTDLTISTAAVTGGQNGIDARNYGTGATSITSSGLVTGGGAFGVGIYARHDGTNNLTINTAAVTGNVDGINARNNGTGATSITSSGLVTGTSSDGINALHYGTNLTISTVAVTGGISGIGALNNGTGATSITSSGLVTGTAGNGIFAANGTTASDLTISTVAVTGNNSGINANNDGTGITSITSTGAVTGGAFRDGIFARSGPYTISLTIGTAAVTGDRYGIYARNEGKGATSITSNGAVTGGGKGAVGIYSNAVNNNAITLNSGASVSTAYGNAIKMRGGGTNSVTVNSGASVTGNVDLQAGNTMTLNGGTLNVANGFTLNVTGNVTNTNGIINLRSSALQNATITGDFTGGGQLLVNADFATNTADKLIITGSVLAGGTSVSVADTSTGAATGADVTLVSVGGTTAAGNFTLAAPVVRGAFNYNNLALVGQDWVLKSIAFVPVVPGGPSVPAYTPFAGAFEAIGQNLLTAAYLPSLLDRTYGRFGGLKTGASSGDETKVETPVWLRFTGGYRDIDSRKSSTGANFDTKHYLTQVGIDFPLAENASGRFIGGINAGYHSADTDVRSTAGKSNLDTTGYSIGLSGTWYGVNDVYVDAQLQRSWFDTDLSAGGVGAGKVNGVGSDGYSASIEVGRAYALNDGLSITPQAQLAYANVDADNFKGANAEVVKLSTFKSLRARLGAVLRKNLSEDGATFGHVQASAIREFEDETNVNVSSAGLANVVDRWSGLLGLGVTHAWVKGTTSYELTGAVSGSTSLNNIGDSKAAQGTVNFKASF